MSTFFNDIQGALRVQLSTLPNLPPVAWENYDYSRDSTVLYLRPTALPAETTQASLGDDGKDLHNGIYQVDVFIPDGLGRTTWADEIADHFKRGTVLTQNTVSVRITTVQIEAALKDDNFYMTPVSIGYQAFTAARS